MFLVAALLSVAANRAIYRRPPSQGLRHYRYESSQMVGGRSANGYRMDFDLEYSGGAVYAIVRNSFTFDGTWQSVEPDADCRAAMHGDKDSLARVKLSPLQPDVARSLGAAFLPLCAPPGIFFPVTDILNVALIPTPHFRATELTQVGQSLPCAGFHAAFDRAGVTMRESSPACEISLVSLDRRNAAVDWKPALADLQLVKNVNGHSVTLAGTEHFAFESVVDRRTGELERARTAYDDLDLKIVGAPDTVPHVRITRTVTIEPLSE